MKRKMNYMTMILTLMLAYEIRSEMVSSVKVTQTIDQEDVSIKAAEIENLFASDIEIPAPIFDEPPKWEIAARGFGIFLFSHVYKAILWMKIKYQNVRDALWEESAGQS